MPGRGGSVDGLCSCRVTLGCTQANIARELNPPLPTTPAQTGQTGKWCPPGVFLAIQTATAVLRPPHPKLTKTVEARSQWNLTLTVAESAGLV